MWRFLWLNAGLSYRDGLQPGAKFPVQPLCIVLARRPTISRILARIYERLYLDMRDCVAESASGPNIGSMAVMGFTMPDVKPVYLIVYKHFI